MTDDMAPWDDARRAWRRLTRRLQNGAPSADEALSALADIRELGHLLREAELIAVRAARRQGGAWAEIATRLGIARQSAWERWRELDEPAGRAEPATGAAAPGGEAPGGAVPGSAVPGEASPAGPAVGEPTEAWDDALAGAAWEQARTARQQARAARSRGKRPGRMIEVPDVVGLPWDDARQVLHNVGLVAVGPDPDGPPLAALGWPGGVVVRQHPAAGARLPARSPVTVWVERGGGSAGVREPRRPGPSHGSAARYQDETVTGRQDEGADEAVG